MKRRQARHEDAKLLPLVLDNLSLRGGGGRSIVDGVSCQIHEPGCTILLGPNGAGKTSVLKLCHGIVAPSGGELRWGGLSLDEARRHQAMVFQKSVLLRRSVSANIDHALKVRGLSAETRRERIAESLAWAGLSPVAGLPARRLSGGEQQILNIARAWALDPAVLLLDEPTANLDPRATRRVENLIQSIVQSGKKVIMATHDIAQARRLAADVLFFSRGCLLDHARAEPFFGAPSHPIAAGFINGELVD